MDNKFFGINPDERATIPDAKRATGFQATQEPYQYINQALFELKTDHIIGTAAQLAAGSCTCKYQSSDQTLRDADGTEVTFNHGDRVYIIGLDTLTADFDLSAYDRLRVISDPSITLINGSFSLVFGDDCVIDLTVSLFSNLTYGAGLRGYANGVTFAPDDIVMSLGKGISFGATSDAAGMSSELLDDYEEGTWTPGPSSSSGETVTGAYTKIGNLVHFHCRILNIGAANDNTTWTISGLPFTCNATYHGNVSINFAESVDWNASDLQIVGYVGVSTSVINLFFVQDSGSAQNVQNQDVTSAVCDLIISGFYRV